MKINYNLSAAIANNNLLNIEGNLKKSMERLSSGLKINHAKDAPAGIAISNKMQAQIDGLDRASRNASDGISVIQIADGALNESTSILSRMRELAVQAANDAVMSLEDKQAIQAEIDSLKDELDRISTDTEYNTKPLLDGSLDTKVFTDHAERVNISDHVKPGNYKLTIEKAATQAESSTSGVDFRGNAEIGIKGVFTVNGSKISIEATDTYDQVYEKIRDGAQVGETLAKRDENDGSITFVSDAYGKNGVTKFTFDSQELATKLGFGPSGDYDVHKQGDIYVYGQKVGDTILSPTGENPVLAANPAGSNNYTWEGFSNTATVSYDGNKITVSDVDGFSMSFVVDAGYENGAPETDAYGTPTGVVFNGELEFEVTEIGPMIIHIGANKDQNMSVRIPEVSSKSLYVDGVDVTTVTGADRAIATIDKAVSQLSAVRSSLGAYQNRLEHSVASLDTFEENMTSAISRLTDADMAEEMTNYTQQNVLNQAAISVLTQANDLPQQVLQIMQ